MSRVGILPLLALGRVQFNAPRWRVLELVWETATANPVLKGLCFNAPLSIAPGFRLIESSWGTVRKFTLLSI
jgi:hypothetical protein